MSKERPKRALRIVRLALLVGGPLLFCAYVALYFTFNDKTLARFISEKATAQLAGRLVMEKVHWSFWNPSYGKVKNFSIFTPHGREVIHVPEGAATVDLFPLFGGNVQIHDIRAGRGTRVVLDLDPDTG